MEEKSKIKDLVEWTYCIVIAVILALLIRYYVGTPTIVKQPSMYPTLKENERLVLNRWSRTTKQMPKRGDIVTFEAPSKLYVDRPYATQENAKAEYTREFKNVFSKFIYYVLEISKTSYIKRVIALPGEHVKIENGKVYINDVELEEPYLQDSVITTSGDGNFTDLVVPEGTVFLMGDNRSKSADSRRFGCIPVERIESKVLVRFWPLNKIGKIVAK